jgi:hypothetical protein
VQRAFAAAGFETRILHHGDPVGRTGQGPA